MSRTIAGIIGKTGTARRSPASLAGDQFVGAVADRPDQHRLQDADLADRRSQFGERLLVEVHAWLMLVGDDAVDRQIDAAVGASPSIGAGRLRRDQSAESLTQTAESSHD